MGSKDMLKTSDILRQALATHRLLVPALGLIFLTSASAESTKWSANRVSNPSFETLSDDSTPLDWSGREGARQPGPVIESLADVDSSTAKTGVHSLKLQGDANTTRWLAVESEPIPVRVGARYKISAWMKGEDIRVEAGQYHNCNIYIQFRDPQGEVVQIGGSPVRGTNKPKGTFDWRETFAIVIAPQGASHARVGCALTCSGTVWFDDVALYEAEGVVWSTRKTPKFTYRFTEGDRPNDDVLKASDAFAWELEKLLDVRLDEPIAYYKYASLEQKRELTTKPAVSHIDGKEIHSTIWDERQDVVHVLMARYGQSMLMLGEGVAVYGATKVAGGDPHERARVLAKGNVLPSLTDFLDPGTLYLVQRDIMEAEFGSFVSYLIERFGLEKFKKVYPYESPEKAKQELPARFEQVYGQSFANVEKEWRDFLLSGAKTP